MLPTPNRLKSTFDFRGQKFFFIHCILSCLVLQSIYAKTFAGKIQGQVYDPSGKPVPEVAVMIVATGPGDITDQDGYFNIENVAPGSFTIKFQHIGYQTKLVRNVLVTDQQPVILEKIILEQRIIDMDGVVVTATRTEKPMINVANAINLVSARIIKQRNAKTSAEALREEPGIFVQKTNHGGGSAIIRGLSSNQILILVDGIRLNNSTYRLGNHQYLTTVDNHIVQQIEVVHGPTSVLYGSDALGGTINLISTTPTLTGSKLEVNYNVLGRFGSVDDEKTLRTGVTVHNHNFALQTGFSYKDYGDLRRGKNSDYPQLEKSVNGSIQRPSGYQAYDFDSKLLYDLSPGQLLIFAYQRNRQKNVPRYDKYEIDNYYRWLYHPQDRDLLYLVYDNTINSKYLKSLRASVSWHRQKEGREMQKNATSSLTRELDDVHTTGITLQLNSSHHNHDIIIGSDIYLDKVFSERVTDDSQTGSSIKDLAGRYPDGALYNSVGLFLQDQILLTSKWSATAGVRFSYYHTRFERPYDPTAVINLGEISQNFQAVTGSLGFIRTFNNHVFLNANVSQAFRAPNLSDITKLGESKGKIYEVPNPDLEPEKMLSFDVGFKLSFDQLKVNTSVYYARISDLLASADATFNNSPTFEKDGTVYKIKAKKNIGNAFIRGFEAALGWNFYQNFSLHANLATAYGQNTSQNDPVGGIPPIFGRVGVNWLSTSCFIDCYTRFAGKQSRLSLDDKDDLRIPTGGTPGWYTLNIRAGWNWTDFAGIQFAIENLTDYNYREHGSGINGPGRNFILTVELKN